VENQIFGAEKLVEIRAQIDLALEKFLSSNLSQISQISPDLADCAKALQDFALNSGKRFRPTFTIVAAIATGADPSEKLYKAAIALELIHVCALIHDDLMDGSDTRRGVPAIHKRFESIHLANSWKGKADNFGSGAAILIGDLALVLADKALHEAEISNNNFSQVSKIYDELKIELMAGQFLDVFEQTQSNNNLDRALKIATFKSGKYSVERPLHFGAALTTDQSHFGEFEHIFSEYGIPLGIAFQLRDDLLGVFGDPAITGKPVGDDIREGKRTALIALAMPALNPKEQDLLNSSLGRADLNEGQVKEIQALLINSGAVSEIESIIENQISLARDAISNPLLSENGKILLEIMIEKTTKRNY
jgi:geranylgeranyl diphosphate synthase type I